MAKIYTKTGYTIKNDGKPDRVISKAVVVKAIADQTKLKTNIETNLKNLEADLAAINNA